MPISQPIAAVNTPRTRPEGRGAEEATPKLAFADMLANVLSSAPGDGLDPSLFHSLDSPLPSDATMPKPVIDPAKTAAMPTPSPALPPADTAIGPTAASAASEPAVQPPVDQTGVNHAPSADGDQTASSDPKATEVLATPAQTAQPAVNSLAPLPQVAAPTLPPSTSVAAPGLSQAATPSAPPSPPTSSPSAPAQAQAQADDGVAAALARPSPTASANIVKPPRLGPATKFGAELHVAPGADQRPETGFGTTADTKAQPSQPLTAPILVSVPNVQASSGEAPRALQATGSFGLPPPASSEHAQNEPSEPGSEQPGPDERKQANIASVLSASSGEDEVRPISTPVLSTTTPPHEPLVGTTGRSGTTSAVASPAQPMPPAAQVAPAVAALVSVPILADGGQQLVVRLDPRELGAVEIRIDRQLGTPAKVELSVSRPETLALLLRDQDQLHRALDRAGVPAEGRILEFNLAPPPPNSSRPSPDAASAGMWGSQGDPSSRGSRGDGQPSPRHRSAASAISIHRSRAAWRDIGIDITA